MKMASKAGKRKTLCEKYKKEINKHKVSKSQKGIKIFGIPLHKAEELMDRVVVGSTGEKYPMGDVGWVTGCEEGVEAGLGGVAAWAGKANKGLYIREGYGVKAWTIVGMYGGVITENEGQYVLEMTGTDGGRFRVDARRGNDCNLYGLMNEDIHKGEVNALLEEMGFIIATKDMVGPCELLTQYGTDYDWDHVKWESFAALKKELDMIEGWDCRAISCSNMREARMGNAVERLMGKIVDGKMDSRDLHSVVVDDTSDIAGYLTSGMVYDKHRFGKWGAKEDHYEMVDITRNGKRASGLMEFAKGWNAERVTRCKWSDLKRLNERIASIDLMVRNCSLEVSKKYEGGDGRPGPEETQEKRVRFLDRVNADEMADVDEVQEVSGKKTRRSNPDARETAESGRIKTTMFMGTGKRRKENLRIINGCKNADELKEKMALLRIWRVEVSQLVSEDKVDGDGYCGYSAMAQVMNDDIVRYDLRRRADRLTVGCAVRNIIDKARGTVRKGFERFEVNELNAKERAEMAYRKLMANEGHFLAYRGLEECYWMRGMLVDGRCDELKFSSWVKSHWNGDMYMLQESQHDKRGDKLTVGEWRRVLEEKMLMCRESHYHTRMGGLTDDFERTINEMINSLGERLGINGNDRNVDSEIIRLEDATPCDRLDSLLVAEAIIARREADTILDINRPGTLSRLRDIREVITDGSDESGGCMDSSLGPKGLTYAEMRDLCLERGNGLVVIKDGVMERKCTKTERPDVILDEDLDHFYLNGAEVEREDAEFRKNKIVFWNCNGWGGDLHSDKDRTLAEVAHQEGVDMICVTDTRLDDFVGAHVKGKTCTTLKNITGKTWTGRAIGRREDKRIGGALILHTMDWVDVKITEKIKYGVCTEIVGKWNGMKHNIMSVYRPCLSTGEGSLRVTLDGEMRGKMEENFWREIGETGNENVRVIGGDFNLSGERLDEALLTAGNGIRRVRMNAEEVTFRRQDGSRQTVQESTIDHFGTDWRGRTGCKTSDCGMDMNDHAIVIGWVEFKATAPKGKEMRSTPAANIRPTDKGAIRKFEKIFSKTSDRDLKKMNVDDIMKETMKQVKKIAGNRNNKTQRDGWSPVSWIMSMRISVHGTAVKLKDRPDYKRIMKSRVEDLRRREKKMLLSEEEMDWMRDQGIRLEPVDWDEWNKMYGDSNCNMEQMLRLKRLNSGRRRRDLRMLCNQRMYRIQADADAGRIGGAIRLITQKKMGYKMECIVVEGECLRDSDKIDEAAYKHFKKWFDRSEKEISDGRKIDDILRREDFRAFEDMAKEKGMPMTAIGEVWRGMGKKELCEEGIAEGEALSAYTPTFEEFEDMIRRMNPNSTGGISGLTYFMVQKWETRVKERVFEELKDCWIRREVPKGWGDSMLAPIPKVEDPTMDELRPLMLFEVLRKIWTGMIMDKIRKYWSKWNLIDENQHGFMNGKGTHTAIPILVNCMEAAKDFSTDLYLSSWDIKRAFDSLGPEFVIRSLERLHIPKEIAEYLVNMDNSGKVYVRTPKNEYLNANGKLKEGRGFVRGKGVGQGDVPSPMLWVAAFDSLLTALGGEDNGFKTQDIEGRTRVVKDIAFADDLVSVTSTIQGLQRKADIISSWCLATGVEIAVKKLRTFGIEWGVKKNIGQRVIHLAMGGGETRPVEVKEDGIMTHLGVVWNMDLEGTRQWTEIKETIERIGEEIIRGKGRMRDKAMVVNYCMKASVLYRLQFCTWDLREFKKLDVCLNKVLRKITRNMKNFPGALMGADAKHGGLGLRSLSDEANERKLKILVEGIHKDDQTGFALEGMVARGHRVAGQGGIEDSEMIVEDTLGPSIWLTSVQQWLKENRLDLKTCGSRDSPQFASLKGESKEDRIRTNKRGIVLRSEDGDPETYEDTEMRVGQCWKRGKDIIEIVGMGTEECEIIRWEGKKIEVGKRVKVSKRNKYEGYPTGMGARERMKRKLIVEERKLVELSRDSVKGHELSCEVMEIRNRGIGVGREKRAENEWNVWKGKTFRNIYTDGSWKETHTMRSMMLGHGRVKAGGGIVMAGDNMYSPLYIEMDLDTESAFQVETVALLAGCMIGSEGATTVNTDCKGAMAAEGKRNRDFNRILGGWKRGMGVEIKKVKAHPERRGGEWSKDDEGIFLADTVASGTTKDVPSIRATTIIGEVARKGKIMVCGENGEPYIGNIRLRCSREKMRNYWKRRDKYRNGRGRLSIWEGTNMDRSHKMMGRNRSLEDRCAVQRMAGGKRWCTNWANDEICRACGCRDRSESHALRQCGGEIMMKERKPWMSDVSKTVQRIKDRNLRGVIEETWTRMRYNKGGEMAMLGCFQPRWVDTIYKGRMEFRDGEERTVMRVFKMIGEGARKMIKLYSEIKEGGRVGKELRQLNLRGFYGKQGKGPDTPYMEANRTSMKRKKKKKDDEKREGKVGGYVVVIRDGIIYWEFKKG